MIDFTNKDLKEIFSLFSISSTYELNQIYDPSTDHFYELENLNEEYELVQEKKEFALDSLRSILYYLVRNGYEINKGGHKIDIEDINETFFV